MRSYRSVEFVFLAGIIAVIGCFLILGAWYYAYNWSVFAFPLVLGLLAIVLTCLRMITMLRGGDKAAPADTEPPAAAVSPVAAPSLFSGAAWAQLGWMLAMLVVSYLIGFLAGPALVVGVYVKVYRFGWLATILMILGTLAIAYLGFTVLLQVPLPLEPFWSR